MQRLHREMGNKWTEIAHKMPGRTDSDVKNRFHKLTYYKPEVRKRIIFCDFMLKLPSFCLDRLGTNIGRPPTTETRVFDIVGRPAAGHTNGR